jgi:hypothetical protein
LGAACPLLQNREGGRRQVARTSPLCSWRPPAGSETFTKASSCAMEIMTTINTTYKMMTDKLPQTLSRFKSTLRHTQQWIKSFRDLTKTLEIWPRLPHAIHSYRKSSLAPLATTKIVHGNPPNPSDTQEETRMAALHLKLSTGLPWGYSWFLGESCGKNLKGRRVILGLSQSLSKAVGCSDGAQKAILAPPKRGKIAKTRETEPQGESKRTTGGNRGHEYLQESTTSHPRGF